MDLARLAGCSPAGVICEVLDERRRHGAAARAHRRSPQRYGLKMITIKDLIEYRIQKEKLVRRAAATQLPDRLRRVHARSPTRPRWTTACRWPSCMGDVTRRRARAGAGALGVPHRRRVRLARCDCGSQLHKALAIIERGRGAASSCTCARKGAASGCSTSCAPTSCRTRARTRSRPTRRSGFRADLRDYGIGAQILRRPRRARTCASSPTTRRRSSGSRATASTWSSACRSRFRPPTRTAATSRPSGTSSATCFTSFPD